MYLYNSFSETQSTYTAEEVAGIMTVLSIFLVIWMLWGVVCSFIAGSKGRSRFGWFICGCFLGIVAFVLILCLSNEKQRYYESQTRYPYYEEQEYSYPPQRQQMPTERNVSSRSKSGNRKNRYF